ncbi:MAG: hypothetical protein ACE5GK_08390 [Nitrospiria bacterium]
MFTQNSRHLRWMVLTLILIVYPHSASAGEVDIKIPVTGLGSEVFKDFSEEIGLAISYLPMSPAEPLGILGWDIGVELSAVDIDRGIWSQLATDTPPGTVLFPKIHLQKGLPFSFDIGAIYSKVPSSNIEVIGGELKWAFISGNAALPAIAVRGSYTTLEGVDGLDLETVGADVSISKGFLFATPYVGYGQVWVTSEESVTPLKFKESLSLAKPFVGVKVSLALINFVFEADFGEIPIYTGRLNLGF